MRPLRIGRPDDHSLQEMAGAGDSGKRLVRWINAVRGQYTCELSTQQKVRFLARVGARSLTPHKEND